MQMRLLRVAAVVVAATVAIGIGKLLLFVLPQLWTHYARHRSSRKMQYLLITLLLLLLQLLLLLLLLLFLLIVVLFVAVGIDVLCGFCFVVDVVIAIYIINTLWCYCCSCCWFCCFGCYYWYLTVWAYLAASLASVWCSLV